RAPLVRDELLVHEPGARADRPLQREVRPRRAPAPEEARREGGGPAPAEARRGADQAHQGPGRVHGRAGRGAVQARELPVLIPPDPTQPSTFRTATARERVPGLRTRDVSACKGLGTALLPGTRSLALGVRRSTPTGPGGEGRPAPRPPPSPDPTARTACAAARRRRGSRAVPSCRP